MSDIRDGICRTGAGLRGIDGNVPGIDAGRSDTGPDVADIGAGTDDIGAGVAGFDGGRCAGGAGARKPGFLRPPALRSAG